MEDLPILILKEDLDIWTVEPQWSCYIRNGGFGSYRGKNGFKFGGKVGAEFLRLPSILD